MKNLKVYLTLFVSILFFSQNLWAQELMIEKDRSLKTEKRIDAETKVKVQDEILKLEDKRIITSEQRSAQPQTAKRASLSSETIPSAPLVNKTVNSGPSQSTTTVKPIDQNSSVEKKEVQASKDAVIAKKNQTATLYNKTINSSTPTTQRVSENANNTAVKMTEASTDLFYNDTQIKATLKQTNPVLYNEYLKERQTIASVLNRVNANTFKNQSERTKYTQLLNTFKQKYNF